MTDRIVAAIGGALERFPHLLFGFLFGSAAAGRLRSDSDLDVAVYQVSDGYLEIEAARDLEREADIQVALERATQRNVDLLVLNRAPASVCAAALISGRPVLMRDRAFYTRYFLAATAVASDFLETEREYRAVRDRSRSLSAIDRSRLERILDFIGTELSDRDRFRNVTLDRYHGDRDLRRNLDRWVEMLINAAIDIGKIVLASERRDVPYTYGQIPAELEAVEPFSDLAGRLRPLAPLRNILAHEYLELRFGRVERFVASGAAAVEEAARISRLWLRDMDRPETDRSD
jgi:uncharacterized protein YutE (UPF0331/DUF86 family)/predicted nucleotidyltransferase